MSENEHYDVVARELLAGQLQPGSWARALAESDGNVERAKAAYIRIRVASLVQEDEEKRRTIATQQAEADRLALYRRASDLGPRVALSVGTLIVGIILLGMFGILFYVAFYGP